jgi:site-specific DNA recombinase
MKVVIYIRVSTDEQAKHGYSIAAQVEKLEAFCLSQEWEIVKKYIDDGYSAKDLNRPNFIEMMDEVRRGGIDVLLVYRLDRLTRSVLDLYEILNTLDENNCKFKSATEVYDTTNAMGRLFITLVAAIAQWERENTGERVRLGMEKKTKLGMWKGGAPPYGYIYKEDKLLIDDNKAEVVNKIFEMVRTQGFYTIAKKLTKMGYQTQNNGDWHVDTIRGIANNPIYAGYLTFNANKNDYKKSPREQTLFEGLHERIIPREEFWDIQDILDKRRGSGGKRETSNYYFSSILKCARCGSSMSGHKAGNGGKEKTYRCSGKKAGKNCTSHIILEKNLVKTIFSNFDKLVEDIGLTSDVTDVPKVKIDSIVQELNSINKLLSKQKNMYENDIIDIDELIKKTEELRAREKELNNELKSYQQTKNESINFLIENIFSIWNHADDFERKQMITTIFTQIVLDTRDEYKRGTGKPREIIIVSVK